jgi:hypothetical protein
VYAAYYFPYYLQKSATAYEPIDVRVAIDVVEVAGMVDDAEFDEMKNNTLHGGRGYEHYHDEGVYAPYLGNNRVGRAQQWACHALGLPGGQVFPGIHQNGRVADGPPSWRGTMPVGLWSGCRRSS